MLKKIERGTILNIGCATGIKIQKLRAMGFKVIGFDLSKAMLQFSQIRLKDDDQSEILCADPDCLERTFGFIEKSNPKYSS